MAHVVLTADQQIALRVVGTRQDITDMFYLSGGTALAAYYLHHRKSDDLDFFTDGDVPLPAVTALAADIQRAVKATHITYEHMFDRHIFYIKTVPELKVEFTKYPFPHLAPHATFDSLRVDSLRDITANKLFSLFERNEPKDFVDLYFLLQRFPLHKVVSDVQKKFDITITPLTLGSELLKVRHLAIFPKTSTPLKVHDLISFFEKESAKLAPRIIE